MQELRVNWGKSVGNLKPGNFVRTKEVVCLKCKPTLKCKLGVKVTRRKKIFIVGLVLSVLKS